MPNFIENTLMLISQNHSRLKSIKTTLTNFCASCDLNIIHENSRCIEIKFSVPHSVKVHKFVYDLLKTHDDIWIKYEWYNENGTAGLIVGGMLNDAKEPLKQLIWSEPSIDGYLHLQNKCV